MFLVKTKLGLSQIEGFGVFADQLIPKGTVTWKFTAPFDLEIDPVDLEKLSEAAKEEFLKHSYVSFHTKKYILCFDNAKFMNHSHDFNCITTVVFKEYNADFDTAVRDILPGEELTCDYRSFDFNDHQQLPYQIK
ncbi:MAG: SET domain-containing protein [bacterium]|nr:SET domain-containing protein [bacterium]